MQKPIGRLWMRYVRAIPSLPKRPLFRTWRPSGIGLPTTLAMRRYTLLPIRRVAAIVGYHDPSRFAQHFRRRFQALPNAYRDQHGSSGS